MPVSLAPVAWGSSLGYDEIMGSYKFVTTNAARTLHLGDAYGIKEKQVGAACLDVYEEEGDLFYEDYSGHIVQDDKLVRLIAMPNVIVTSHQAFLTNEALDNIAATTVNNLTRFFSGDPDTTTEVCCHK